MRDDDFVMLANLRADVGTRHLLLSHPMIAPDNYRMLRRRRADPDGYLQSWQTRLQIAASDLCS